MLNKQPFSVDVFQVSLVGFLWTKVCNNLHLYNDSLRIFSAVLAKNSMEVFQYDERGEDKEGEHHGIYVLFARVCRW